MQLIFAEYITPENTRLIDRRAFEMMKSGVVIINTSRGAIIAEDALLDALQSGKVGGAGVDVIDGEWLETLRQHPLIDYARKHEHVIITPHIGGVTYESQKAAFRRAIQKLRHYLTTGTDLASE